MLNIKREKVLNSKVKDTIHKEKVEYIIKETIGNGSKPIIEFYDSLFVALIDKTIIKLLKHFRFVFESVIEMDVEM